MTYEVALVTDRAGTFATVLTRPTPTLIEGGRIVVATLATFGSESEALAYLREVGWKDMQDRKRLPWDLKALERHGIAPVPPQGQP